MPNTHFKYSYIQILQSKTGTVVHIKLECIQGFAMDDFISNLMETLFDCINKQSPLMIHETCKTKYFRML